MTSATPAVEVGALRMVVAGNGIKCPQPATFRGFSCDKSPLSFGFPLQFVGDTGDKILQNPLFLHILVHFVRSNAQTGQNTANGLTVTFQCSAASIYVT